MAVYKFPVQFTVFYVLLLVFCKANNDYNEFWSELTKMFKHGRCSLSCNNYELTTNKSTLLAPKTEAINDYLNKMDKFLSKCRCDEKCDEYGDCCFDAASKSHEQSIKNKNKNGSWVCLPLRFGNDGMFEKEYYIYMIGNCPVDWLGDESLPDLCQRKAAQQDYSHLLDVPVFSNRTNVTYANIYCAKCHSDTAHLASWNSLVECNHDLEFFNISREDLFVPSNYIAGMRKWSMLVKDLKINCKLIVDQFQKYQNYLETRESRKCLPIKRNCAANWTDPSIEMKCQTPYVLYVDAQDSTIYKNPHCAKCNDVKEMKCYASKSTSRSAHKKRLSYSFAMLIDFNSGENGKGETLGKCGVDQIYNHLHERCHTIVCGFMFENKAGICVPKNTSRDDRFDWIEHGLLNSSCQRLNLQRNQDFFLENETLVVNKTGQRFLPDEYELSADKRNASICAKSLERHNSLFNYSEGQSYLSDICLAISVVCLALHIAIHAALPKLRNLPGKNLLSLSCALFIAQLLFLTGIQLASKRTTLAGYSLCAAIGILIHWSYLAAFFWMNVMGFDICWTFAGSLTRNRRMPESDRRTIFRYYSLYAWGFPTLIVLLGISLDLNHLDEEFKPLYGNHNPSCWMDNWAPAYGVQSCWISNRSGLGIFFVVPVAVLLMGNMILFCITVFSILKQKREAKFALENNKSYRKPNDKKQVSVTDTLQPTSQTNLKNINSNNNNKHQIRFLLYIKLGLIMGLGWIFGFVAALAKVPVLWYPFIFFNALQGAFIFMAFTCKRKIYYMMYYWATNEPHPNDTSSSSRTTPSSGKPSSNSKSNQKISHTTSSTA